MRTLIYEGFFLAHNGRGIDTMLKGKLERDIPNKHITTEFKPKEAHPDLYGIGAWFKLAGYANDGKNEGYSVELFQIDSTAHDKYREKLKALYNTISTPHITLSVSKDGKPKDTANLDFKPVAKRDQFTLVYAQFNGFFA